MLILAAILNLLSKCWKNILFLNKSYKWMKKGLFFKILLELGIECFFELYIYGIINYLTLEYGTLGEDLGFIITFFSLGLIILIILLGAWIFLCKTP